MSGVWLASAIAVELVGTLSLRASDGMRKRLWLIPMVIAYLLSFFFLSMSLNAGMHVGVAYGIWVAAGIAMVALLARVIWKDPLTKKMLAGIGFIVAGVVLIEMG